MGADYYLKKNFRPEVLAARIYAPPRPACKVKLNQNELPWDVDSETKRAIVERVVVRDWRRYPCGEAPGLKNRIAERLGLVPENILMGNGSNELIGAIIYASSKNGSRILAMRPSFGLYSQYADVFGANFCEVEFREDLTFPLEELLIEAAGPETGLTIICNPNNPTGSVMGLSDIGKIAGNSDGLVLVDEAYVDFSERRSAVALLRKYPNVIVTRTFSKAFGMAGLRIGYMAGAVRIVAELKKILPPYNIDIFAEEAGTMAIGQGAQLAERVRIVKSERTRLYDAVNALPGWRAWPSEANFMLFEGPRDPENLFQEFLGRGVLLRKLAPCRILAGKLRISVGSPCENDLLLEALYEIDKIYGATRYEKI